MDSIILLNSISALDSKQIIMIIKGIAMPHPINTFLSLSFLISFLSLTNRLPSIKSIPIEESALKGSFISLLISPKLKDSPVVNIRIRQNSNSNNMLILFRNCSCSLLLMHLIIQVMLHQENKRPLY